MGPCKSITSDCGQSLQRAGLDCIDTFCHRRPDPGAPLGETAETLMQPVRQGEVLYIDIPNYNGEGTEKMVEILKRKEAPFTIHQVRYNMSSCELLEDDLPPVLEERGLRVITFSPLARGLLINRCLHKIPEDSRAHHKGIPFLSGEQIGPALEETRILQTIAVS